MASVRTHPATQWNFLLNARTEGEYIPLNADVRVEVSRGGTTDTINLVAAATGISPQAQAEGFEARKMTIINPPVVKLSDSEFKAAKASAPVADFCLNIPEPASVGEKPANKGQVLIWNGTELVRQPARAAEAASGDVPAIVGLAEGEPDESQLGLPPGNWCMAWNRRDGWPVAAGFRNGRLIFAGSNGNPASLWFSTIGNGRNFTQATAAPVPENGDVPADLDGSEVNADFGMVRVLDSFERVTTAFFGQCLRPFHGGRGMDD